MKQTHERIAAAIGSMEVDLAVLVSFREAIEFRRGVSGSNEHVHGSDDVGAFRAALERALSLLNQDSLPADTARGASSSSSFLHDLQQAALMLGEHTVKSFELAARNLPKQDVQGLLLMAFSAYSARRNEHLTGNPW